MSGFKDTFTKDGKGDFNLQYDDSASYYFCASILFCIVAPLTYKILSPLIFGSDNTKYQKNC